MLANKQPSGALAQTSGKIDINKKRYARAMAVLSQYSDHRPIDAFVVGRQIIIIACALLFKSVYDTASLTGDEAGQLAAFAGVYPLGIRVTTTTYEVLDNKWFSFSLCSVAVAFLFQVTAKVMAQNYPMRFIIMMAGGLNVPPVAKFVGRISLLAFILSRMRADGAKRAQEGKHSYYHDKEPTHVDSEQLFEALSTDCGQAIEEISIEISRDHANNQLWIVQIGIVQRVIEPSQLFAHFLDGLEYDTFEFTATAYLGKEKAELRAQRSQINIGKMVDANGVVTQVQSRLFAKFGNVVSAGSEIVWDIKLTMPELTRGDGRGSPAEYWFEQLFRKPVRRVNFLVEDDWSTDPTVDISSLDGVCTPRAGNTRLAHPNSRRHLQIDYPSINCRLQFKF